MWISDIVLVPLYSQGKRACSFIFWQVATTHTITHKHTHTYTQTHTHTHKHTHTSTHTHTHTHTHNVRWYCGMSSRRGWNGTRTSCESSPSVCSWIGYLLVFGICSHLQWRGFAAWRIHRRYANLSLKDCLKPILLSKGSITTEFMAGAVVNACKTLNERLAALKNSEKLKGQLTFP